MLRCLLWTVKRFGGTRIQDATSRIADTKPALWIGGRGEVTNDGELSSGQMIQERDTDMTSDVQSSEGHPVTVCTELCRRIAACTAWSTVVAVEWKASPSTLDTPFPHHMPPLPDQSPERMDPFPRNKAAVDRHLSHAEDATTKPGLCPDNRRVKSRSDSMPAIESLLHILSTDYDNTTVPGVPTTHTIKSLYYSAKHRSQLSCLSPTHFTTLIHIIGSVSVMRRTRRSDSPPQNPSPKHSFGLHPLALRIRDAVPREHWSFVSAVTKDKTGLRHTLNDTDRYWLMRAKLDTLADVMQRNNSEDRSVAIQRLSQLARRHYLKIRPPQAPWSVHSLYLRAIADIGDTEAVNEVVSHVAKLLRTHGWVHRRIAALLWQTLSISHTAVSAENRYLLLEALRKKISDVRTVSSHDPLSPSIYASVDQQNSADSVAGRSRFDCNIVTIRDTLSRTLLSSPRSTTQTVMQQWAVREACAAFYVDAGVERRLEKEEYAWTSLILLSVSLAAGPNMAVATAFRGHSTMPSQVDWVVVCILAALETIGGFRRSKLQGSDSLLRSLWVLWRKDSGSWDRPAMVMCGAVVTFIRLAIAERDADLINAILRHIANDIVVPTLLGTMSLELNALQCLALEQATVYALRGDNTWDAIFRALLDARLQPAPLLSITWSNNIANKLLIRLSQYDIPLTHRLYLTAGECNIQLEEPTILYLAKAYVHAGHLDLALACLLGPSTATALHRPLLDIVLPQLLKSRTMQLAPSMSKAFSDVLVRASESLPLPASARAFEWALLMSHASGYSTVAVIAVINVLRGDESYFCRPFLNTLNARLRRRRRHDLARRIDKELQRRDARSGAATHAMHRHASSHLLPLKGRRPHPLFAYPGRAKLNRRVTSLNVMRRTAKIPQLDRDTLKRILYVLVFADRWTAAWRMLRSRLTASMTTDVGNVMLLGSFRRRSGGMREKQRFWSRFEALVDQEGFIPDAATINLLVRARLRWNREAGTYGLRRLFDRFVASGYPDGSPEQSKHGPFGTLLVEHQSISHSRTPSLSFERHIRPLYRMFVKAFYDRGDKEAAFRIESILREVGYTVSREFEQREKARRAGRMRSSKGRATGRASKV